MVGDSVPGGTALWHSQIKELGGRPRLGRRTTDSRRRTADSTTLALANGGRGSSRRSGTRKKSLARPSNTSRALATRPWHPGGDGDPGGDGGQPGADDSAHSGTRKMRWVWHSQKKLQHTRSKSLAGDPGGDGGRGNSGTRQRNPGKDGGRRPWRRSSSDSAKGAWGPTWRGRRTTPTKTADDGTRKSDWRATLAGDWRALAKPAWWANLAAGTPLSLTRTTARRTRRTTLAVDGEDSGEDDAGIVTHHARRSGRSRTQNPF